MTPDAVFALLGFALVMSITPGPSNLLLLASGANFGIVRSLPLLFGISSGFLLMVLLVGLGLGGLLERFPAAHQALRFACAAYVLWLAAQIVRSRPAESGTGPAEPIGFVKAALFQWVNPKAWTAALIVNVNYALPGDPLPSLAWTVLLFALVNVPSIGVWLLSGTTLRRLLSDGRRLRMFNMVMALLLVGTTFPALFNA
ncbi:MAG: LysE family translocator [Pseudodesulfovibrio sp.]|uniref:LysE family translocator n=1 Tax=Pseudodesulfovibrio sp. TaxID=2035812 RepID=UPI003D0C884B